MAGSSIKATAVAISNAISALENALDTAHIATVMGPAFDAEIPSDVDVKADVDSHTVTADRSENCRKATADYTLIKLNSLKTKLLDEAKSAVDDTASPLLTTLRKAADKLTALCGVTFEFALGEVSSLL